MEQLFSVAIDGPSGAGKSTVALALSLATGALYLDTGAMYRAFGLFVLRRGVDPRDPDLVAALSDLAEIDVRCIGGRQRVCLGNEDVTDLIRTPEAAMAASAVSAVPRVRARLVAMQRMIAKGRSVVMDGRDIGTAVLPDATLKIYLTASPEERAKRRCLQLSMLGNPTPYARVLEEMEKRDRDDSTRAASPLRKADDAIEIDSGSMSADEVVARVRALLDQRLDGEA